MRGVHPIPFLCVVSLAVVIAWRVFFFFCDPIQQQCRNSSQALSRFGVMHQFGQRGLGKWIFDDTIPLPLDGSPPGLAAG